MGKTFKSAFFLLIFALPLYIHAATLSIAPASGTVEVGDRLTLRVVVSSATPINAISGLLLLPTDIFSVDSVSKAGSLLNFWVTEPGFTEVGELHFEGVTLGGYSGGTANVITVILHAIKTGQGTVSFKSGSILANDGQGTDVTDSLGSATFSVIPATGVKTTEPPVSPEPRQQAPTLNAPEISLIKQFGEPAINGISPYPTAQVLLTYISEAGVKVFITGETNDNGQFVILVPSTLRRGAYTVTAQVIKKDLTHSPSSNEILIHLGSIWTDVGWSIWLIIFIILLLLIYLTVRSYYYLYKNKNFRKVVRKEAREAEDVARKSFKLLHQDIDDNKDMRQVQKEMDEAEDMILKEIKDIESS
ncbi:hypothetical protein KW790_01955 [Candidatus Parcubacteria bacterium]|nr:hypothetical protein [Candidatus Parcubacteria bacterium]